MNCPLNRTEILAAQIRHKDWDLPVVSSKDVWSIEAGGTVDDEARAKFDRRIDLSEKALEFEARYADQGIWIATAADEDFPRRLKSRLGSRSPALLYGFGNRRLLNTDGVGVVGSRNLTDSGADVAGELARAVAGAGRILVSGGARGTDQIAMREAALAGGSAVGILTHPLSKMIREGETQQLAEEQRVCLATPFRPDMGFTVANAMARNKIIYALTDCTVVVASDLNKGGSWNGAIEALRAKLTQVAAWVGPGEGPGNRALCDKGAVGISDVNRALDAGWLAAEHERLKPQMRLMA